MMSQVRFAIGDGVRDIKVRNAEGRLNMAPQGASP
jgi:hypothetical protein